MLDTLAMFGSLLLGVWMTVVILIAIAWAWHVFYPVLSRLQQFMRQSFTKKTR